MPFPAEFRVIEDPIHGRFVERLNRFACLVSLDGTTTKVFLPNSGRLEELLQPEADVLLERRRETGKTHHDLLLARTPAFPTREPIWAALDSRLPPKLLAWAIDGEALTAFSGCKPSELEPQVVNGRLDLLLSCGDGVHYVEAKSVNLVDQSGTARFPDAPTDRGRRHLRELIRLGRVATASIVFVVVREDAQRFSPFVERDPEFAAELRRAQREGVQIHAFQFQAGPSLRLLGALPVDLFPPEFPGFWPPAPQLRA